MGRREVPPAPTRIVLDVTARPRVVGVDPSLTGTGIATSTGLCYRIGEDGVSKLPVYERLDAIAALVEKIVRHVGSPDLVVVETPLLRGAQGASYDRYLLWADIVRALRTAGVPTAFANVQSRMRYATGSGGQRKGAVVDAVARRLSMFVTNGDDNMADAAILCAAGCDWLGEPLAPMPATHRAALDAITWPDVKAGVPC